MKFQYRLGTKIDRRKLSASVAGRELERIRKEQDGRLTPQSVVESARSRKSPLHDVFEWDDAAAAHKHRLQFASMLICSVVSVVEGKSDGQPTRHFVSVVQGEKEARTYTTMAHAMSDSALRDQVLRRAMTEAKQWKRRYLDYQELAQIFSAIEATAV